MINFNTRPFLFMAIVFATSVGQYGCSGVQPLPTAARSGDTVALGIGTIRGLGHDDVTVTLTSDANPNNPVDLTPGVRSVFNLYPDPVSEAARYSAANNLGHSMQTMIVLDLPTGLPTGPATIHIDTAVDPTLPDISDQSIEILPGTGQPHAFEDAWNLAEVLDISSLEPLLHGIITVTEPGGTGIAAVEFEIDYDETVIDGSQLQAVVVPKDMLDLGGGQRVFYPSITWATDGDRMRVQLLCANCVIPQQFFRVHVIYPPDSPDPALNLVEAKAWNTTGTEVAGINFELATGH